MNKLSLAPEGTSPAAFSQANAWTDGLDDTCQRLRALERRVQLARAQTTDAAPEVQILAVSKGVPAARLRQTFACGQTAFGENYVQEAMSKIEALHDLPIEWHFIGPIQANKTRTIAEHFSWVHSVDRLRVAERLSQQRPHNLPSLQVCIQVNIDREASKSGVLPEDVSALAHAVALLPGLRLRGLMAIPQPSEDRAKQEASFRAVRQLMQTLNQQGLQLDTLSMGMSGDLEAAITQGATWVRIGTALFGERTKRA